MGRYVGTGKNRRYQVHKSPKGGGKKRWMFAKAPGRKTSKARARTTRKSPARRRTTTVARRKNGNGKRKFTVRVLTLAPAALGVGSSLKDTYDDYKSGGFNQGMRTIVKRCSGIDVYNRTFKPLDAHATIGLGTTLVTKKIVDYSGVNKLMTGVPVVRF